MKARLLRKVGTYYAGQVLTNVQKGDLPAGSAEYFEDNDPAVMTVVEQTNDNDPLMVINDEINPEHAKAHNEAQRAAAKSSEENIGGHSGAATAIEELERQQTQERARHSDDLAAERSGAGEAGVDALSEGQKQKNAAGKGPADLKQGGGKPKAPKATKKRAKQ